MKRADVEVGGVYKVRIGDSLKLAEVRIDCIVEPMVYGSTRAGHEHWEGTNLGTGRTITGTAARLRSRVG